MARSRQEDLARGGLVTGPGLRDDTDMASRVSSGITVVVADEDVRGRRDADVVATIQLVASAGARP